MSLKDDLYNIPEFNMDSIVSSSNSSYISLMNTVNQSIDSECDLPLPGEMVDPDEFNYFKNGYYDSVINCFNSDYDK